MKGWGSSKGPWSVSISHPTTLYPTWVGTSSPSSAQAPILAGLRDGTFVYFVHSYYVVPDDRGVIATETDYPQAFCSMVWRDNLFATQFHPEKSQADGLRILRNFADLGP